MVWPLNEIQGPRACFIAVFPAHCRIYIAFLTQVLPSYHDVDHKHSTMGTLSAGMPELAEHCPHKLPTSCRLTATPTCCACQDNRPHSAAYPTYVDGVGLVSRGTRWQRYCWFCKEFWANRVAAVRPALDPRDTRIPEEPDQAEFVDKWFAYKRGFRLEKDETTGAEHRVEVQCEKAWRDVPPGELPVLNHEDRIVSSQRVATQPTEQMEHVSLDATLDALLAEAEAEEAQQQAASATARTQIPMTAANTQDILDRLRAAHARLTAAVAARNDIARQAHAADAEVRAARELKAALARENQALRLARIFGTREEMQASDYVSPLTNMFARAYDRYQIAEEVRSQERVQQLGAAQERILAEGALAPEYAPEPAFELEVVSVAVEQESTRTLDDGQDGRPPPMSAAQMTLTLDCKVCLQQKADTAVLPCGHLVMCSHCAAIAIPTRDADAVQPWRRDAQCPFCRKQVRRLARIFTA
ncbi:hypothetical protein FH972_023830 [Carpinus fangiana]|uniref:RING-type domain-containing protein n=1 Tax=Carpinus fangiana TaxID=176857 RepID=A0A5N6KWK5_9ROSI|nr:hypothetical protein FH972_023830 [Carpinus fangiana]